MPSDLRVQSDVVLTSLHVILLLYLTLSCFPGGLTWPKVLMAASVACISLLGFLSSMPSVELVYARTNTFRRRSHRCAATAVTADGPACRGHLICKLDLNMSTTLVVSPALVESLSCDMKFASCERPTQRPC
jgi:hypothetical protein